MTETRVAAWKPSSSPWGAFGAAARVVDGRGDGDHERAAELEPGVHEAAGQALLLGGDAVRGGDGERPVGETEPGADQQKRWQHRGQVAGVEPDRQEQREARHFHCQADGHQARQAEALHERGDARGDDQGHQAGGEDRQAGLERRPAARLLQVGGEDELEPDECERAASARPRAPGARRRRGRPEGRVPLRARQRSLGLAVAWRSRDERVVVRDFVAACRQAAEEHREPPAWRR
jgi:hypothetical protein